MFQQISLALSVLAAAVQAQTYTTCNPLTSSNCPADSALSTSSFSTNFQGASGIPSGWQVVSSAGSVNYNSAGANFVVAKQGDSPTIETNFYILFGSFEVKLLAAGGQGIVSSIVMESDDLDEVDWEFTGTNTAQVQSNYFGKGDTTTYDRAAWHAVGTPQATVHTYKVDWTPSAVTWSIDGAVVRTLNYNDAQGGSRFPQTPMRLRLGIWAGGDPSNGQGTIEWAGGPTDYSKAPFTMVVQSVNIVNYSPAKSYSFQDNSGSYQKINIDGGSLMSGSAAASATSATSSLTTSLSIASAIPTVLVAAPGNVSASTNATPTTGPKPSGSGGALTTSGSGSGSSSGKPNAASIVGSTANAVGVVALTFLAVVMTAFL